MIGDMVKIRNRICPYSHIIDLGPENVGGWQVISIKDSIKTMILFGNLRDLEAREVFPTKRSVNTPLIVELRSSGSLRIDIDQWLYEQIVGFEYLKMWRPNSSSSSWNLVRNNWFWTLRLKNLKITIYSELWGLKT